mgnify:CR=1 FL=1
MKYLTVIFLVLCCFHTGTSQTYELGGFIGMVNFYRSMGRHRAHIMAPLTKLVGLQRSQFKQHWGPEQDEAFEAVKALISQDVLLRYPNPNLSL